jgi:hypothetical protein
MSARHLRVVLDDDGAARRPAGRVGIVAVIVMCIAAYLVVVWMFGRW